MKYRVSDISPPRAAKWGLPLSLIALAFGTAMAQSTAVQAKSLAFEVVSIKPHLPGDLSSGGRATAGRLSYTNISLSGLVAQAYAVPMMELISGIPKGLEDARFDVEAKIDEETVAAMKAMSKEDSFAAHRMMMRQMLENRFKLKAHEVPKEVPEYALMVAKGGFKLKPADPNSLYENGIKGPDGKSHAGTMMMGMGVLKAQAVPISSLVTNLQGVAGRIVVDRTAIVGKYDFELHWSPEGMTSDNGLPAEPGVSIYTALQEQMGLRLEPTKGPANAVIVDHIEMPSEN